MRSFPWQALLKSILPVTLAFLPACRNEECFTSLPEDYSPAGMPALPEPLRQRARADEITWFHLVQ